ncbi:MAG: tetraacyldisaccharide 4'-kinase [Woeseiaceae bacterium]|nr:tetraacyldisaccharide 4'-kinase [Woeseiaceae bacterium]
MTGDAQQRVNGLWYGRSPLRYLLAPLSWLYGAIVVLRARAYRHGILSGVRMKVPVVVVGNLTTGGTGKTPLVIALVRALAERGLKPGVISRGYRGRVGPVPVLVGSNPDPAIVGDEPLLIARRTGSPVAVHPDRVAAARLLEAQGVDIIIADDGLQHYRLARDFEIAVVDARRGFGNGWLLPAGPLREPIGRLQSVDRILLNAAADADVPASVAALPEPLRCSRFRLEPSAFRAVASGDLAPLDRFSGERVHAVAGIGHPERFFATLKALGADVIAHPRPDHAAVTAADLDFDDGLPVVMTEKDAVKCPCGVDDRLWALSVDVVMEDDTLVDALTDLATRETSDP